MTFSLFGNKVRDFTKMYVLNSHHPHITLKYTISDTSIDF